jgi:hypothetical protein
MKALMNIEQGIPVKDNSLSLMKAKSNKPTLSGLIAFMKKFVVFEIENT